MEDLRKYVFREDMKKMAVSCIGNKKGTAESKARKLFDKYDKLILCYEGYFNGTVKDRDNYRKQLEALKTGNINFEGGFLRISEIEYVKKTDTRIAVFLKSGKEVGLTLDFKYLLDIF